MDLVIRRSLKKEFNKFMPSRIAIIPARGGSKRIPNKNIRDFCGKPMIEYVLNAAKDSGLFKLIHVSTDSDLVANIVSDLGFPVDFMRPIELSDDYTPIMPVLKFVLERFAELGSFYDQVWLLMPCAPNISASDLVKAALILENASPGSSLVTVSEYPVPIEWAFEKLPTGQLRSLQPGMFAFRSQDIKPSFYDTGTFAAFNSNIVLNSNGAHSDAEYVGYVLPKGSAIDIDNESDWINAEALFRAKQAN